MTTTERGGAAARTLPSSSRPWPACEADAWAATRTGVAVLAAIDGDLDVAALRGALRAAMAGYAAPRTAVTTGTGGPVRRTATDEPPAVAIVDLSTLPPDERDRQVAELSRQAAIEPMTADAPGRVRCTLLRLAADRHLLVAAAHRAILDAPSLAHLLRDTAAAYAGEPVGAPERDPFVAFVAGRAALAASPDGRAAESWWRERLAGAVVPDVPPHPADPLAMPARRTDARPGPAQAARELAARFGYDPAAVLLAGWVAVLSRYCGLPDVAVGTDLDQRPEPGVVGPLGLEIAVRVDLADDPTFGDLIARVERAWREAQDAGPVPAPVLAGLTGPGQPPLLRTRFAIDPPLRAEMDSGPTRWTIREPEEVPAAADLTLHVDTGDAAPLVWLAYAGGRDPVGVDRMLGHLGQFLAADPASRLSTVPMLTPEERARLAEWNDTAAGYPDGRCVHELIEERAGATPFAVAVTANGEHLTYRELDERANRLAHLLRGRGVGPDVLVGVFASRTVTTITAMLAVLKAGGAYVPLDPGYPGDRLGRICRDAQLGFVIAEPDRVGEVPFGRHAIIAADAADAERFPVTRPDSGVGPDNLAYVIYTSGSTGQPKGVLVPHRQIVNSTAARWAGGRFSPGSYAPPVPLSFDASCAAIYWSLCRGGRLVLPTDAEARDPRLFAKLIKDEHITHITGMPSFYALVLTAGAEALRTLRDVSIGGEAMPPDVAAEHRRTLPLARLYNDYGPTEGTVWSTAHRCDGEETGASVPIGRPIQNVRVHLLDGDFNPVPVGVPGQVCIAGDGLARGYLGLPALTAQRFVPDPFGAPGTRMYLTGDRAVRLPDGELRFLGRLDAGRQVKVRGFRVELAEIEAALHDHPAVAAAAVAATTRGTGDTRLAAHLVAGDPRHPPDPAELGVFLRERLPDYMIPARFVLCPALPVTAAGKIDRAALAAADAPRSAEPVPAATARAIADPGALRQFVDDLTEGHLDRLLDGLLSQTTNSQPRTEGQST
jgi:amino acid adenylation domain-containing protein